MNYEWTSDMREISGFGGDFEKACRDMLSAALDYWELRGDDFNPNYRGKKGTTLGRLYPTNADAVALDGAMSLAVPRQTTAMHHTVVVAVMYVRRFGWEAYCALMRGQAKAGSVDA